MNILKDLISFNTIKDKENKEIINYIEKFLLNLKFKTEYKGKYLIMSYGKDAKLGFLGHTDTVEIIDGWNTNPFELTQVDEKLYGLGVCDMKGGISAFLNAIKNTDLKQLKNGIKVYFTYDEEIGFSGIYDIVKNNEKFPEIMIFGEPTNNEYLIGGKGLLEYELYFNGIKAHSSNPEKGKSANINAIKALNKLNNYYENYIKIEKNSNFEIPYTTMNIGIINGGSAKNSIPANCLVCIDFRIAFEKHIEIIKNKIKELSKEFDFEIKIIEQKKPFFNKIDFIEEGKTANFITEASFINQNTRKIILGVGPVTAHELNEYITKESYEKLIKQYEILIREICL